MFGNLRWKRVLATSVQLLHCIYQTETVVLYTCGCIIYSFIFCCLSGTWLCEQWSLDLSLPATSSRSSRPIRDISYLQPDSSTLRPFLSDTFPKYLPLETPESILTRSPNHLNWHLTIPKKSYSSLSFSWMTELLILSLSAKIASLQRKIILTAHIR